MFFQYWFLACGFDEILRCFWRLFLYLIMFSVYCVSCAGYTVWHGLHGSRCVRYRLVGMVFTDSGAFFHAGFSVRFSRLVVRFDCPLFHYGFPGLLLPLEKTGMGPGHPLMTTVQDVPTFLPRSFLQVQEVIQARYGVLNVTRPPSVTHAGGLSLFCPAASIA